MAPLKDLEKAYPIIDGDFQSFCAAHGIFSVGLPTFRLPLIFIPEKGSFSVYSGIRFKFQDFLLHDLYILAAFAGQQTSSERLKEGIAQMLSIINSNCRLWSTGLELLEEARQKRHLFTTGNKGIDSLLHGGFCLGQLIELVGPSSSGKTQICMQAAAAVAEKHHSCVLYVDTSNSFSARRIAKYAGAVTGSSSDQAQIQIVQKVLSRISCQSVFDIFGLFDILRHLESDLGSQVNGIEDRLQLLIIDSISSLISPILGGHSLKGRAMMISAGYLLKKLAHEHNLAILVTNHTVSGEGGMSKPALGEAWKSTPHVRLLLSRDHRTTLCSISILKHTSMESGKTVKLAIDS